MKTYTECEQDVQDKLRRSQQDWPALTCPVDRLAREAGFMKSLAVDLMYEIEVIRDNANTREMHALLERLGGK